MIMFMAVNRDIRYALDYHEATKHSEASLMTSRHYLDFDNKPLPFKIYFELPSVTLPINFPTPEVNALCCISGMISQRSDDVMKGLTTTTSIDTNTNPNTSKFDNENLPEIWNFSAGITTDLQYP